MGLLNMIRRGLTTSSRWCNQYTLSHPSVQKYMSEVVKNSESDVHTLVTAIMKKQAEMSELASFAKENPELEQAAKDDISKIVNSLEGLEQQFFRTVVPRDKMDYCTDVILEVNAGVGGQEAMLFSNELLEMYQNYADFRGWECHPLSVDKTELGGIRHASLSISGPDSYSSLKYEGGVHRVQRVPKTEKSGRIHTSTSSIAILAAPSEIDIDIPQSELKIETKRASGAGGMHVNTTESAVRITHIPTGIQVDSQAERSQIKNRSNAMKTLRAKLYELENQKQQANISNTRKLQIGLKGRNEKIRTYNYVQDRLTDHRISYTVHNLKEILLGYEHFDALVQKMNQFDTQDALQHLFNSSS